MKQGTIQYDGGCDDVIAIITPHRRMKTRAGDHGREPAIASHSTSLSSLTKQVLRHILYSSTLWVKQ